MACWFSESQPPRDVRVYRESVGMDQMRHLNSMDNRQTANRDHMSLRASHVSTQHTMRIFVSAKVPISRTKLHVTREHTPFRVGEGPETPVSVPAPACSRPFVPPFATLPPPMLGVGWPLLSFRLSTSSVASTLYATYYSYHGL